MGDVRAEIFPGARGPRVGVRSPWHPRAAERAKQVPGASWRKEDKIWSYPLSLETCRSLRSVYGDDLAIGPELWVWAKQEVAREQELSSMTRMVDARLRLVPQISPHLEEAMGTRTYQRVGAAFVAKARSALLADQPSMGKTAMALAGLMEAGVWEGAHLVIAPLTAVKSTWVRQITEWGTPTQEIYWSTGSRAERTETIERFSRSSGKTKFLVINPAMLRVKKERYCKKCDRTEVVIKKEGHDLECVSTSLATRIVKIEYPNLFANSYRSVILDESHELLAAYKPKAITQSVQGLLDLPTTSDAVKLALTGTPMRGRETRLWGTLDWIDAIQGGYWAWISTFFEVTEGQYGKIIGGIREDKQDAFGLSLDRAVLRRTKKEVRKDLPDNQQIDVWVAPTKKQLDVYSRFKDEGEVKIEEGILSTTSILAELTRLRQLAFGEWAVINNDDGSIGMMPTGASPKIDWLIQALAERGVTGKQEDDWIPESGGHKYVIASQFTQVVDAVERRLNEIGIVTAKITGAVTGKKRDAAVASFDGDPKGPRVMLINTKAGGVSIDLDTYCDELFFLDETFVEDDQEQVRGRIDNRKGEVRPRTFFYIRTEGTIEEGIANSNVSQANLQSDLLDRRRGADVALRILKGSN